MPPDNRLPVESEAQPFNPIGEDAAIERVLQCHPEVEQARAELQAVEVEQELARNRISPELRGFFQYSRDLGNLDDTEFDITLPGNVYEAGVVLSMPLLLRTDRGRARAASAKVEEQRAALQFLEDQLRARVRGRPRLRSRRHKSELGLPTGWSRPRRNLPKASVVASRSGRAILVFVNLREQQAAFAEIRHIEAVAVAEIEMERWDTTVVIPCP